MLNSHEAAEAVSQERQTLEFRVNEIYGMLLHYHEAVDTMRTIICILLGVNIGALLIVSYLVVRLLQAGG